MHSRKSRRTRQAVIRAEPLESRRLLTVAVGEEFLVNTFTTDSESGASIAADAEGNFVVVWQSDAQDGSGRGVYGQLYNAAGATQGAEFLVNQTTGDNQFEPSVDMDSDGNFVVAWTSYAQDGDSYGVFARRFNAAGVAQGGDIQVNTFTLHTQNHPDVAVVDGADFLLVWESSDQDGDNSGIYGQRFDSTGTPQGGEFRVNSFTTGAQSDPAIAADADGNFVVTWDSQGQDGGDGGVYARRYNSAGVAQGTEFRVNQNTVANQIGPDIAADPGGNFVVVWADFFDDGDVYFRRFNAAGAAQGDAARVNAFGSSQQIAPAISMDAAGNFLVAWQSYSQDRDNQGVYARKYNAAGVKQSGEIRVNTFTTGAQSLPAVAMDSNGEAVVAWQSSYQDGSSNGIYAQRFAVPSLIAGSLNIPGSNRNDVITLVDKGASFIVTQNKESSVWDDTDIVHILINTGDGNDKVTIGPGIIGVAVLSGADNDTVTGGDGADTVFGGSGKDRLIGNGGKDELHGGKHNDTLTGGNQNDKLYGEEGNDSIDGGTHNDRIFGGTGRDTMLGGKGDDKLTDEIDGVIDLITGGAGNDTAVTDGDDALSQIEHIVNL